ncbi:type VII secretion integral membrane protein EccD [Amycolatopsis sp. CA-230715]|uniref:type VII secretion integral membrane protein EccD n=1 Tax=Amycolatopsis sp. CA-230715 TaxID=2745196 RepID=UPI001C333659|nr:type VII secretion integral membrane protein EccD [Amycolatopsis sp. CA-230715]QWF78123.1 ESX-5 secretion system protein EccD5 [Amycolatopsis sp. CA-230715]
MTAARRVTVVTPLARMDVALPPRSTLAELVPQLVRLADAEGQANPEHPGWVLSRLGGAPLAAGLTVADAAVRDGEVLCLNPRERPRTPLLFDDVVDSIASVAGSSSRSWGPEAARRAGLVAAAVLLVGSAVLLQASTAGTALAPVACGVLAVVLLLGGGALSRAYGDAEAGVAVSVAGFAPALLAGMSALPAHPPFSLAAGPLGCGLAAVTAYGVLAAVSVADRVPWFVAVTAAAALGAVTTAVVLLAGSVAEPAAAVLAVVVTALTAAAPMLALRLGKLPLPRVPDDIDAFRADERPSLGADMVGQTAYARRLLGGLLVAAGLVLLGCAPVLVRGSGWDAGLLALLGVAWTLRSRSYSDTSHRVLLLVPGFAALGFAAVWLVLDGDRALVLPAGFVVAVAAAICVAYAGRVARGHRSPYWARVLDIAEFLALVSLVPMAAMITGVYEAVRG